MLNNELLNRLHPLHCVMDISGALHFCSDHIQTTFPGATSIYEMFAKNSADELIALAQSLNSNSADYGEAEVFSIQRYSAWFCKIARLEEEHQWLVCLDPLRKKYKSVIQPEALSPEEIFELQRQVLFYEALLQQLPAEVAVFDPEFKFLFVNQHAIKNEELRRWLIGRSEIEYWKSKNLPLDKAHQRIEGFKKMILYDSPQGVTRQAFKSLSNLFLKLRLLSVYTNSSR